MNEHFSRKDAVVDWVIITALPEERNAMLSKLPGSCKLEKDGEDTHTYYGAKVETKRSDHAAYHIIVTCLAGVGPQAAVSTAQAATQRWNPACILLVGIAGGLESKVALGDVLIASMIVDYSLGRIEPEGRRVRWQAHKTDATLYDSGYNLSEGWQGHIAAERPIAGDSVVHYGVIASGGDVIAFDKLIAEYDERWGKLIGVEMEGCGVASAVHDTMTRPRFLMVRGVSDYADQKKATPDVKRWRKYACDVAAAYTLAFLEEGPIVGRASDGNGACSENP